MTDITDQDLRDAREWADRQDSTGRTLHGIAARVLLALVDAPAPTLADELRQHADSADNILNLGNTDDVDRAATDLAMDLRAAATVAEQVEQDRDHYKEVSAINADQIGRVANMLSCAKIGHPGQLASDAVKELIQEWEALRAEVEIMTTRKEVADAESKENAVDDQKGAHLPDPAGVPAGQAWLVKVGDTTGTGIPDADPVARRWATYLDGGAQVGLFRDDQVTLVARLIPDPRRVIGTVQELEDLPSQAVVRPQKKGGILWEKGVEGLWYAAYMPVRASQSMDLPVWVIDMPESVSDGE